MALSHLKYFLFIFIAASALPLFACLYLPAVMLAEVETDKLREVSGIAASRKHKNIFWVHNDSGDGPYVYALESSGKLKGALRVKGATAEDWEDMSLASCNKNKTCLYLGDIGDNGEKRRFVVVYTVEEPESISDKPIPLKQRLILYYPDAPHNAETLLVSAQTKSIYIVTKERNGTAGVYKTPLPDTGNVEASFTMQKIAELNLLKLSGYSNTAVVKATGGDISPDGKRMILRTYGFAMEFQLNGKEPFDAIFQKKPAVVETPVEPQGEAIAYTADGNGLVTLSEGKHQPLYFIGCKR